VPYAALPPTTLVHLRQALVGQERTYTTNYDLLLYWAIISNHADRVKDYFFSKDSPLFDRALAVPAEPRFAVR
jgi:hypothetical protein